METKNFTAVDWLVDELEEHHVFHDIKNTNAYQIAKQMEKEQMFEYIKNNIVIGEKTLKFFQEEFEKYYNKKFNNLKISKLDLF